MRRWFIACTAIMRRVGIAVKRSAWGEVIAIALCSYMTCSSLLAIFPFFLCFSFSSSCSDLKVVSLFQFITRC